VVCDRCNHGPLANIDEALVQHPAIALLRTTLGIPTKAGRLPVSKWGNALISTPAPQDVVIQADSGAVFEQLDSHRSKLNLRTGGPIPARRYKLVLRAIWKIALECMYIDHGEDAYDSRYDEVRAMVLGSREVDGCMLMPKECIPSTEVALHYRFDRSIEGDYLVVVQAVFFGIPFFTELLRRRLDRLDLGDIRLEELANVYEFPAAADASATGI
jgi:hypothetical protein